MVNTTVKLFESITLTTLCINGHMGTITIDRALLSPIEIVQGSVHLSITNLNHNVVPECFLNEIIIYSHVTTSIICQNIVVISVNVYAPGSVGRTVGRSVCGKVKMKRKYLIDDDIRWPKTSVYPAFAYKRRMIDLLNTLGLGPSMSQSVSQ